MTTTTTDNKQSKPVASFDDTDCIVLLADQYLLEMPLEALQCLQTDGVGAISRDISLSLLHHRFKAGTGGCTNIYEIICNNNNNNNINNSQSSS